MESLKIITCNVRGLGDERKRRQMFKYLQEKAINIAFLQETHSSKKVEKRWRSEWGGNILFDHGDSNARGVCIMFSKNLNLDIDTIESSSNGRYLIVNVKMDEKSIMLCNIYAPNVDQPHFFTPIINKVKEGDAEVKIMGGDINQVLDPTLDKKGGRTEDRSKSASLINSFLSEQDWFDVWRILNPDSFRFTWKRHRPLIMSRLDYLFMPQSCMNWLDHCTIMPGFLTDHSFVFMELCFTQTIKGRGFWKFNNSLLSEKFFVDSVNEIIDYAEMRYDDISPALKWEMLKKDITEYAMHYSKVRSTIKKQEKEKLLKQKLSFEKKLACINLRAHNAVSLISKVNEKIDRIDSKLKEVAEQEIRGVMIRSKARWLELGERSTKYFLSLEKSNANRKNMSMMHTEAGETIKDPRRILNEQKSFYEKLYTSNYRIKFEMNQPPPRTVNEELKKKLDGELTLEELAQALSTTERNKSPGPDGISADFYKVFFIKIKHTLLAAFNDSIVVKRVYQSGGEGIITLLPKKGKDTRYVKNWRPITLLCADYKLLSKVIANRLRLTLDNIIHEDQAGFIPGRSIAHSIRKTVDGINLIKREGIEAALLLVDFEKAFDRVEYLSLLKALTYFKFGPKLIEWVKLLFTDFRLCIVNNGLSSDYLTPT